MKAEEWVRIFGWDRTSVEMQESRRNAIRRIQADALRWALEEFAPMYRGTVNAKIEELERHDL